MGFLLRLGVWGVALLMLLPIETGEATKGETVDAGEALGFVGGVIADTRGMCDRRPDLCETGAALLETLGVRAREGAKIAYEYLDQRFGESPETDEDRTLTTASVPVPGEGRPKPE